MGRESIAALKKMVDDLQDRDMGIKRDMTLFESVFQNFPIPATIWLINEKGLCTSRRVTDSKSQAWDTTPVKLTCVLSTYRCKFLQETLDKKIKEAVKSGKTVSFTCSNEDTCVWIRLVPRFSENHCVGVIGLSLDVTSSYKMIKTLVTIRDTTAITDNIRLSINRSIEASYVWSLLDSEAFS